MTRFLHWISTLLALFGGLVIAALAVMSTFSIVGRWLYSRPIFGDVELVQMGCALAIALFLPYAQMSRAHIIVDFFTAKASRAGRLRLDGIGAGLLGLVCLLLAWRAGAAVLDMRESAETTMVLGLPVWPVYVGMVLGLAVSGLVGLNDAWNDWRASLTATEANGGERA